MLTVPLWAQTDTAANLLDLAVALYECEQVGIGRAAEVAGLAYGRMIDELGRRSIPVVRHSVEDLERELEYVRTLADSR
jgi:predicted HTH domain antitoxin